MAPPAAVVALALAVRALPEVAVAPALLSQPPVLALSAVLVPLGVVVALAAEEEPEALVELLSRQSFSAAMARTTP